MGTATYSAQPGTTNPQSAPDSRADDGAKAIVSSGITLNEVAVTEAVTRDPFLISSRPQAFRDWFAQAAHDFAAPYATSWEMTHDLQLQEEDDTIHISCMMHEDMQQAEKAFFESTRTQPREGDTALYVQTFDFNRRVIIFTFKAFIHTDTLSWMWTRATQWDTPQTAARAREDEPASSKSVICSDYLAIMRAAGRTTVIPQAVRTQNGRDQATPIGNTTANTRPRTGQPPTAGSTLSLS